MPTEIYAAAQCGKCGNALDTKGSPKWCKECRNTYQRDYKDQQYAEAKTEGYAEGFAAGYAECRTYLMQHFNPHPLGQFRGIDILNYLRDLKPATNSGGIAIRENNVPRG